MTVCDRWLSSLLVTLESTKVPHQNDNNCVLTDAGVIEFGSSTLTTDSGTYAYDTPDCAIAFSHYITTATSSLR